MKLLFFVLSFLSLVALFSFKTNKINFGNLLEKQVNDFALKNTDSKIISLKNYPKAKGFIIVFTCNHCPFAKLYTKRLNNLNTKYSLQNVPLIAINSMDTLIYEEEGFDLMQKRAATEKYNFPYLYDPMQTVGRDFSAEHTPQVFVIWKENNSWIIKYSGAIDDNGEHPEKATSFVANAVEDLLNNKPVSKPKTESFGCRIFYRKN